jgi:hypothetical protein
MGNGTFKGLYQMLKQQAEKETAKTDRRSQKTKQRGVEKSNTIQIEKV